MATRWLTVRRYCPEPADPGAPAAGVEHRRAGLVHEEPLGAPEMRAHPVRDRPEVERGAPGPVSQRGAVELDALAAVDARLPIERQMVAELGDQHMGDQRLGGQAAGHDALGRVGLRDRARAFAAGVFRAARHQHAELGRHDIETLGAVLADPRHRSAATGTQRGGGLDHPLDARQMRGQPTTIALDREPRRARRFQRRVHHRRRLLLGGVQHALGDLHVLQGQVVLVRAEPLGARTEPLPAQIVQHQLQTPPRLFGLGKCRGPLGQRCLRRRERSLRLGEQGLQRGDVIGDCGGHEPRKAHRRALEAPPRGG